MVAILSLVLLIFFEASDCAYGIVRCVAHFYLSNSIRLLLLTGKQLKKFLRGRANLHQFLWWVKTGFC
jgi:hypothetical protein